jgi:hypothetical protein
MQAGTAIMRSTVVIYKRYPGYAADYSGRNGDSAHGIKAGLNSHDAATTAARLMLQYAVPNPEGGDLVAPQEVLDLVPEHLKSIDKGIEIDMENIGNF